jgi:hypothetical protein
VASAATDQESTATETTAQSAVRPAWGASAYEATVAANAAMTTTLAKRRLRVDPALLLEVVTGVEASALTASRVLRVSRSS